MDLVLWISEYGYPRSYPSRESAELPPNTDFVSKPFRAGDLTVAVQRCLARAAQAREELAHATRQSRELRATSGQIRGETVELRRGTTESLNAALERAALAPQQPELSCLTPREIEVLRLIADGHSTKQVATGSASLSRPPPAIAT